MSEYRDAFSNTIHHYCEKHYDGFFKFANNQILTMMADGRDIGGSVAYCNTLHSTGVVAYATNVAQPVLHRNVNRG